MGFSRGEIEGLLAIVPGVHILVVSETNTGIEWIVNRSKLRDLKAFIIIKF
jgi:hypothetical protein